MASIARAPSANECRTHIYARLRLGLSLHLFQPALLSQASGIRRYFVSLQQRASIGCVVCVRPYQLWVITCTLSRAAAVLSEGGPAQAALLHQSAEAAATVLPSQPQCHAELRQSLRPGASRGQPNTRHQQVRLHIFAQRAGP